MQKVNVTVRNDANAVRNDANAVRYVVEHGALCSAFGVAMPGSPNPQPLDLELAPFASVDRTSCLSPTDCAEPHPASVIALQPSETWSFAWDARALSICYVPDSGCAATTHQAGALRPVEPGDYIISVPYFQALPSQCTTTGGATFSCGPKVKTFCPPNVHTCEAEGEATANVTITQSGEVGVTVSLE